MVFYLVELPRRTQELIMVSIPRKIYAKKFYKLYERFLKKNRVCLLK